MVISSLGELTLDLFEKVFLQDKNGRLEHHLVVQEDKLVFVQNPKYALIRKVLILFWKWIRKSECKLTETRNKIQEMYLNKKDSHFNILLTNLFIAAFNHRMLGKRKFFKIPPLCFSDARYLSSKIHQLGRNELLSLVRIKDYILRNQLLSLKTESNFSQELNHAIFHYSDNFEVDILIDTLKRIQESQLPKKLSEETLSRLEKNNPLKLAEYIELYDAVSKTK